MKRTAAIIFFLFLFCSRLFAQDNDLLLAKQFANNGELQKALEIYQKLYKRDNEAYYYYYVNSLLGLKKFDEAENITKKMLHKHPGDYQYIITLGRTYTQKGDIDKADKLYDDIVKDLPADANAISNVASQFYQAENTDYAIKIFLQGRKLLHNNNLYAFELISLYRYKRDKEPLTEEYLNFLPDNPTYITQAENALSSIYEGEADYNMLKIALFKRIQKDAQQTVYIELLIWQFLQQKEFDQALNQAIALSRRQNDDGSSVFDLCQTFISNEAYETAIRGYEYIISKGLKYFYHNPESADENHDVKNICAGVDNMTPKNACILLNADGNLYHTHCHEFDSADATISICSAVDNHVNKKNSQTYNPITSNLQLALQQIIKWYKSHADKIVNHIIQFTYHITNDHWSLGLLFLEFNHVNKLIFANIKMYNPLPACGGKKIINQDVIKNIQATINQLFKTKLVLDSMDNEHQRQQNDGNSCGVITAENGKAIIDGSKDKLLIEYPANAVQLRLQHLKEVKNYRFYTNQKNNQTYEIVKKLPTN